MFFIFGFVSNSFSQEKTIIGRIIIDVEDESSEGIFVTNLRTQITAITDLTGSFSIHARLNDELLIRSHLYETRKFILSKQVFYNELISIHLNMHPIVLEEAVISQKLTGYLDKDVKYQPSKDVVAKLYKELGINPDASKLRDTTSVAFWKDYSPFYLNVETVLESQTGQLRKRKNLYDYEDKENKLEHIRQYFGDYYFVNELNIPKEKIRDFLFYAYESSDIPIYYSTGNYLSILYELNLASKVYLRRLSLWYLKPESLK